MSVYAIALVTVTDPPQYAKYVEGFMEVFDQFEGELVAADSSPRVIEGKWPCNRTVILRFPSEKAFKDWYHSDVYQALIRKRQGAACASIALISEL